MKTTKTEKTLLGYFKLFSVTFTTVGIYIGAKGYIDVDETYIKVLIILLALPFGVFYSFFWIGYFEKNNKMIPILLSGLVVVYFYTTWVPGIKTYFDSRATKSLQHDPSYVSDKKSYAKYAYDPVKYSAKVEEIKKLESKIQTAKVNLNSRISELETELTQKRVDKNNQKTLWYKGKVGEAIEFRNNHPEFKLAKNMDTVNKIATALAQKELYEIEQPTYLAKLKNESKRLSDIYLAEQRDIYKSKIERAEATALQSSYTTEELRTAVLIVGFFVEIVLNALLFWRNLFGARAKESNRIGTMMTLLNKALITERLRELGVTIEKGKHKGRVKALYATLINIVVLYNEKEKEEFKRYSDISNKDICNFKYLDVYAERHINKAFSLLEGKKVQELELDELEEIIQAHEKNEKK